MGVQLWGMVRVGLGNTIYETIFGYWKKKKKIWTSIDELLGAQTKVRSHLNAGFRLAGSWLDHPTSPPHFATLVKTEVANLSGLPTPTRAKKCKRIEKGQDGQNIRCLKRMLCCWFVNPRAAWSSQEDPSIPFSHGKEDSKDGIWVFSIQLTLYFYSANLLSPTLIGKCKNHREDSLSFSSCRPRNKKYAKGVVLGSPERSKELSFLWRFH